MATPIKPMTGLLRSDGRIRSGSIVSTINVNNTVHEIRKLNTSEEDARDSVKVDLQCCNVQPEESLPMPPRLKRIVKKTVQTIGVAIAASRSVLITLAAIPRGAVSLRRCMLGALEQGSAKVFVETDHDFRCRFLESPLSEFVSSRDTLTFWDLSEPSRLVGTQFR